MLKSLKTFVADSLDFDELISLSLFARQYRAECDALQIEQPVWLDAQTKAVRRELRDRYRDRLETDLARAKARAHVLKPTEQKRADADAEVKRLEELVAAN